MKKKNIAFHILQDAIVNKRELKPTEKWIVNKLLEPWYKSILY